MTNRRDYITEIEAKRARNRSHIIAGAFRLHSLNEAFRRVGTDGELLRYFPVALIAIVEGHIRDSIRRLIDQKPGASSAFLSSSWAKEQKFDMVVLQAIAGRRISLGELIAHLIPIKSVETINTVMSALLGETFTTKLGTVHDRWDVEVKKNAPTPIISDAGAVLGTLATTFRARNVLAHEPMGMEIVAGDVEEQIAAVAALISATDEIVSQAIEPDAPLTQTDMNIRAGESARAAESELDRVLAEARQVLEDQRIRVLEQSQEHWVRYRDAQVENEGLAFEGGSIRPTMAAGAYEAVTKQRIADVRRLLVNWEDPAPEE